MGISVARTLILSAISMALLAGCGEKGATQVAAKVNGKEISVSQVALALQNAKVSQDQAPAARNKALAQLIDQELMVQRALEKKLDRNPEVMLRIETAKRVELQRAYAELVGSSYEKVTEADIKDYFTKHPELFSQRRFYIYRTLAMRLDKALQPEVQTMLTNTKDMTEVVAWLKEKNVQYITNGGTSWAEQLPLTLLPYMSKLTDGQVFIRSTDKGMEAIQLIQSKVSPKTEEQAHNEIEVFLTKMRQMELVKKDLDGLRGKASIDYMGDFSAIARDDVPGTVISAPAASETAAPVPAASGASAKGYAAGLE